MEFCGTFPRINLPPGPLLMLHLLWRFREQTVRYETLRQKKAVAQTFGYNIKRALELADLPWRLECEKGVGFRLHRVN